jgi:hypothetical protein
MLRSRRCQPRRTCLLARRVPTRQERLCPLLWRQLLRPHADSDNRRQRRARQRSSQPPAFWHTLIHSMNTRHRSAQISLGKECFHPLARSRKAQAPHAVIGSYFVCVNFRAVSAAHDLL